MSVLGLKKCIHGLIVPGDSTLFPSGKFLEVRANMFQILTLRKRKPRGSGEGGKERMKQFPYSVHAIGKITCEVLGLFENGEGAKLNWIINIP